MQHAFLPSTVTTQKRSVFLDNPVHLCNNSELTYASVRYLLWNSTTGQCFIFP